MLIVLPIHWLNCVVLIGFIAGIILWWFGGRKNSIRPVDQVIISSPKRRRVMLGIAIGLIGALLFGFLFRPDVGLSIGLSLGAVIILEDVLENVESQRRTHPNQGIIRSLKNIPRYIIYYGLLYSPILMLFFGPSRGIFLGLLAGLIAGLSSPAGQASFRHYLLRWVLHQSKSLPLRLVPFLEAMRERLMLRHVGGGYIYIHRYLMEYFASLSEEELDALVDVIEGQ